MLSGYSHTRICTWKLTRSYFGWSFTYIALPNIIQFWACENVYSMYEKSVWMHFPQCMGSSFGKHICLHAALHALLFDYHTFMGGTHEVVVIKYWSNRTLSPVGVEHVAGHCPRKEGQTIILKTSFSSIEPSIWRIHCQVPCSNEYHTTWCHNDNAIDHTSKAITTTPWSR